MARVSLGHFVVGIEGLALLRACMTDPDAAPISIHLDVPAEDVRSGYARWAGSYDVARNPLIHIEEPAMHGLIDPLPPPERPSTPRAAQDGTRATCGHAVIA